MKELIIIGGGVSGIYLLRRALKCKVDSLLLEKNSELGGIWTGLPDWQDIQIRKEDWALKGQKLDSVYRKDVLKNIQGVLTSQQKQDRVLLNSPVHEIKKDENGNWEVSSKSKKFICKHLVIATGIENKPYIPSFESSNPQLEILHSTELKSLDDLKGKRVCVVGAGASAQDLIENSFVNGAKQVSWIARNYSWFNASMLPISFKPHLRAMALMQMTIGDSKKISAMMTSMLKKKYRKYGLDEIIPDYDFETDKYEIVPGRPGLIKNFKQINRVKGSVLKVEDNLIHCSNGKVIEADILLFGTGFKMDLKFLGLKDLNKIDNSVDLKKHLTAWLMAENYENLYFSGPQGARGSTAAPWAAATLAKTLISHIKGEITLPKGQQINRFLNHWEYLEVMSQWDHKNYSRFFWPFKKKLMAYLYFKFPKLLIKVD